MEKEIREKFVGDSSVSFFFFLYDFLVFPLADLFLDTITRDSLGLFLLKQVLAKTGFFIRE